MSKMYSRMKIESQLVSNQKVFNLKKESIKLSIPKTNNNEQQSSPRRTQMLPKPNKLKQANEKISNDQKRQTSLPPLKYKFLEEMKHQISTLERDSPNVFTRYLFL